MHAFFNYPYWSMGQLFLFLTVAFLSLVSAVHSSPLDSMGEQLKRRFKNDGFKKIAISIFPYSDGRASSGSFIVPAKLAAFIARDREFDVMEGTPVTDALRKIGLENVPIDQGSAVKLAEILGVDAVVSGTLSDFEKKVDVEAVVFEPREGRIAAGGHALMDKTWKDPPAAGCGSLRYVSGSTITFSRGPDPSDIKIVFSEPWWPYEPVGTVRWNYCRQGARAPNINDAMNVLKRKTWSVGGRGLVIRANDLEPSNPKVLKIVADVIYFR